MRGISCLLNFKENLTKNPPYYELLARQICIPEQENDPQRPCISEHTAFCTDSDSSIISRVCEGYQFTVAFSGDLISSASPKEELSACGYPFLVHNDAELALLSYIHFGENCADKLSGNFSMIVYDSMRRTAFVLSKGRDALPFFFTNIGDFYVVSTSLNGILSFPQIQKRIDSDSILNLLSAGNRIPEQIFDGVFILPPDSMLKISQKGIRKPVFIKTQVSPTKEFTNRTGLIFTGSEQDELFLKKFADNNPLNSGHLNIYAEKFPQNLNYIPFNKQHLSIDEGTVYSALETAVSALGFPFLSDFDFILPIALKRAKGTDEDLFFSVPDRFYPPKSYLKTLIKNSAFHNVVEKNMQNFTSGADIFPSYPSLISNYMSMKVHTPFYDGEVFSHSYFSQKLKTTLRRILLDIISKEHAPLFAFFKRSELLRLCEGGFSFSEKESETELIAYLIKLNMWFELFSPKIV